MKTKNLAAKVAMVVALAAPGVTTPVLAGIPVIDGANLTQTVMSAVENVAQTLKQIEQYRTHPAVREHDPEHGRAGRVYLGSGAVNDQWIDERRQHA